jgi:glycosyltransferase involved in cell wall biosynthesis
MSNPIHVFEVSKSTGGVGEYLRWLAAGLDRDCFRLTVGCLSEGGPGLAAELSRIPGVRAFSLAMSRYKINPFSDAGVLVQLAWIIRREKFDLIHAHTSKPGYLARLAAAGTGIPVIYRPACFAFHDAAGWLQRVSTAALERFAARFLTARIMTVCEDERDLARRYHVGRDGQIVTIHTGIDSRPFDAPVDRLAQRAALGVPDAAPLIGTVGRLTPQKAPLDFVQAAVQVHARRPDAHFVWIGNGPLEAQTRALATSHNLTEVFHFAGQRRDVPALLSTLDCFVLSSHWEGFSLAVLEAMAAGLPIVATRVMGASEAIQEGITGLLVSPGHPPALAQAILDLINDPERARRFGVCGRQRVEQQFTRERMIARISQLYQEVYARHRRKNE